MEPEIKASDLQDVMKPAAAWRSQQHAGNRSQVSA